MTREDFVSLCRELDLPANVVADLWNHEQTQEYNQIDDGLIALALMVVASAYHSGYLKQVSDALTVLEQRFKAERSAANN